MGLIDEQYAQASNLLRYLIEKREISMLSYVEPTIKKNFLLQCASLHENEIISTLKTFSKNKSKDDKLANFVIKFIIERQYDRLFQWDQPNRNANKFLAFFGQEFKEECIRDIQANAILNQGIKSFIELGELRNLLIHNNLANFPLDKTIDEVYKMHNEAMVFIQYLKNKLLI